MTAGLPRVIITAELPAKLQAGGTARQPLLWVADNAQGPAVPRIRVGTNGTFTAFAAYIEPGARCSSNGTALRGLHARRRTRARAPST